MEGELNYILILSKTAPELRKNYGKFICRRHASIGPHTNHVSWVEEPWVYKRPRGLMAYPSRQLIGMRKDPHAFYHTSSNGERVVERMSLIDLDEHKKLSGCNQRQRCPRPSPSEENPLPSFQF